jgi:uncharacterized protein (TIGR03435 family)
VKPMEHMIRTLAGVSLIVFASCAAWAQPAPAPPAFEVASIKPAAPQAPGRMMVRMGSDPGRVNYTNVSLKDVLARAYEVKRYQVSGPSWLDSERYDIIAKVPDGVPKEQIPAMLRSLLAERFKMTVHRESKEQPVYALVIGKNGPKLKKSEDSEDSAPKPAGPEGARVAGKGAMMMTMRNGHLEVKRATVGALSDMLSNMLDRPVVDMTKIEGNYDVTLDLSMEELAGMKRMAVMAAPGGTGHEGGPAPDSAPSASIFTAIQQLGLKLDSRKAPVDYVFVDKADKVPTEN